MDWLELFEVSLAGLGMGGILALCGIGFVVVFKATRVVNMAIGEMLMIGAYGFFAFSAGLGLPWWAAVPATLVVAGLAGGLIERALIRPLIGEDPVSAFMVTIGLTSIVVGLVEIGFTAEPQRLPEFLPNAPVFVGQAMVTSKVAWGFAISAAVVAAFLLLFRFWRGGVALRATASDRGAATSVGIAVPSVFGFSWVLGAMVAALAGILVGAIGGISSAMGAFGLSVFTVVVVGGLDSLAGALLAGLFIGWMEAVSGYYLGGEYKVLATFSVLLLVLLVRPYGLFGTHDIERL